MTMFWSAVVGAAILFALFALVPQRACGGRCSGCSNSCAHFREEEDDVAH